MDRDNRLPITAALALAVLLATHALFWLFPGVLELMQARVSDRLFVLRSESDAHRPEYDDTIVHLAIDDSSLEALGSPYLGRSDYARLVRNLGRAEVAAQLHDVIYVAPLNPEEDRDLIDASSDAVGVYYGLALGLAPGGDGTDHPETNAALREVLDRDRWSIRGPTDDYLGSTRRTVTFEELASAATGLGYLDITADPDGVYRRAPLLARDGDGLFPSLPMRIICDYLGVGPRQIEIAPGSITLRDARRPGSDGSEDIRIPVDARGRMIVNYIGPWGAMTHYPFFSVYEASDDRFMLADLRDEIEGKIVVVSWVRTGAGDVGPVPVDALYPLSGIHANVMHSILTGDFLREWSPGTSFWAVELPLLLLVVLLALRFSTVPFVGLMLLLAVAWGGLGVLAFLKWNLILNIPGPLIMLVGWTVVLSAYQFHVESRARAVLNSTFEAFFPATIVRKVTARPDRLLQTAQKKELSILFSDIKQFTSHTENMDPGHVRRLLNEYFEKMIDIVFENGGTLDKFIGDGLMVFFGDPEEQPDHALRAVRTAVAMQQAARALASQWSGRGDMPLSIRVGINTGEVIVGNMGSSRRVSYTVLGEHVNLAQRLESNAPTGGILVSARTRELAGASIDARALEPIQVKGIQHAIEVFEVPVGS